MGFPDLVIYPLAANTRFFFKKVTIGCKKSLNIKVST